MNDVFARLIAFILHRPTVDQIVSNFNKVAAQLEAAVERETSKAEAALVIAQKQTALAEAAKAQAQRAARIAVKVTALID